MAVGALAMLGAYVGLGVSTLFPEHLYAQIGVFLLAAVITALFLEVLFIAPFRSDRAMTTFISTLALSMMLEATVSLIFGVSVQSYSLPFSNESIDLGDIYITPVQIAVISGGFLIAAMAILTVRYTKMGRRFRAIGENPNAMVALGFNDRSLFLLISIVSTSLFFLTGVALAAESNLQPTMGAFLTIKAFAIIIVGSPLGILGVVGASFILALVENFAIGLSFGSYSIPAGYKDAVAYGTILIVMLFFHHRQMKRVV